MAAAQSTPGGARTLRINGEQPEPHLIDEAVDTLLGGGLVAYPTDTLHGLGCDATNADAVARLCAVKGRSTRAPLPVIINQRAALRHLVTDLAAETEALLDRFWPGALTVIFPCRGRGLSAVAHAGTLGVRIPDAPVALMLARGLCRPIVATSANRGGEPPLASASAIAEVLGDELDLILDTGAALGDTASTVLDLAHSPPRIVREGAVATTQIARYLPELAT